ncbi:MAG: DUF433 domain-containing protein [Thermoguttaceae bacterium]
MRTVAYAHIELDANGVPVLAGTRVKVVEVVLDHLAHGSDALEIHRQYPFLTLGQIHSALAYYYDHQAEMDQDIQRRIRQVEQIKSELGEGPISQRLTGKRPPP